MMSSYYIGIDVGATNIRIGIVNNLFDVINIEKYLTNNVNFKEVVSSYVDKYKDKFDFKFISIAFPGIVNNKTKEIINIPNAKHLESITLINEIIKDTNLDVHILRDTNAHLSYDINYHNLGDIDNVLGFYLGTGFGMALKLIGEFYLGDNLLSGEIGHIPFFKDVLCGCGKTTCLEAKVSGKYLDSLAKDKDINIKDVFKTHLKDKDVLEFIDNLARSIATTLNILNINNVVLGGGVINANHFPKSLLEINVKNYLHGNYYKENVVFYYQKTIDKPGIIGSVLYTLNSM